MAARSQPKLLAQGKPRTTGGNSRPWRVRLYAPWVDALISDLREEHKRRPRLQQEFTRAGLP